MAAGQRIRWSVVVQILSVFLLGQLVRIPGLRPDLPLSAQHVSTWTFTAIPWQPLSILCVCLAPLVVVRSLVAVARPEHTEEHEAQAYALRGFLTYLFVVMSLAMAASWELEQTLVDGRPIVLNPGPAFRAQAVAVILGASALVWEFSNQLTRAGVGKGPLVLFGVAAGVRGVLEVGQLMVTVASVGDAISGPLVWRVAVLLLPVCGVLLAFWRYNPGGFPVTVVRGAELLTPVGLVMAPWIVQGLAESPTLNIAVGLGLSYESLSAIRLAVGLGMAAVIAWWLRAYAIGPGDRSWALAAVGLVALPVPVMALVSWVVYQEGPYHGDRAYEVYVRRVSASGTAADDAPVFRARLRALDVVGQVDAVAEDRLRIRLAGVSDARSVTEALLPTHRIQVHVAGDQRALLRDAPILADAALIVLGGRPKGRALDLRRYLASVYVPLEAGRVALDCGGEDPARADAVCTAVLLEEPPIVGGPDIAGARVLLTSDRRPYVRLELTTEGSRQLCWVSSHHVGDLLVVTHDGAVLGAPTVHASLCDGFIDVDVGWERPAADAMRAARTIAAAVGAPALGGTWQVDSVWPVLDASRTPARAP